VQSGSGGEIVTDNELLELAAKAAGITKWQWTHVDAGINVGSDATPAIWNPRTDYGQALLLLVKLRGNLYVSDYSAHVEIPSDGEERFVNVTERITMGYSIEEATLAAIFKAAVEVGKAMS